MEQKPSQRQIRHPGPFRVLWHPKTQDDLADINPSHAKGILAGAEHKLSKAPHLLGSPLKGTYQRLWKVPFSKYRVVYTMNESSGEVWVLGIDNRDKVYRKENIEALMKLAIAVSTGEILKPPPESSK